MQKIILIIGCALLSVLTNAQVNITRVEYFFDTDPGFGNAINIPVSESNNIVDKNADISIAGLGAGLHTLFIRSRDANGKWSVTNRFLFVIISPTAAAANINKVEYFFDTDPGFGNASNIPITTGLDLSNIAFGLPLNAVSDGLHTLFIRSRDANGRWSISARFLFVKISAPANPPNITAAEYFIDSDPGFGNGIPVAINPSNNIADFVMPVNITGLNVATHRFYFRTRNSAGKWSVTSRLEFPIGANVATPFINVNAITKKMMCGDNSFKVSFHATGTYNVGNTFTVELSDGTGSFASPTAIGSVTTTSSSIIDCQIPLHVTNGAAYRVRVVSSNPSVTGATSDTIFTLYDQPRYNDSTVNIICQDETYNLTTVYNTTGFTTAWNTGDPAEAPMGNYQLISSNTSLCKDTSIVIVKQDVAVWTGTSSTNWHTPGNWNTGKVPYEKTHVIINAGTPNNCELSDNDVSIASLQIRPGATMQVINGRLVTITAKCNPLPTGP